jgi:hypothetical protein
VHVIAIFAQNNEFSVKNSLCQILTRENDEIQVQAAVGETGSKSKSEEADFTIVLVHFLYRKTQS